MIKMAKDEFIHFRATSAVKQAIKLAARKHGRDVANYLMWLAATDDPDVKAAYEAGHAETNYRR